MKALPHNIPLSWVLQILPMSKRYLYNLKCNGKIDFLIKTDGSGKPTTRLRVDLPKLCAFLQERGLLAVIERVISTVRKLTEMSDGLIVSRDS